MPWVSYRLFAQVKRSERTELFPFVVFKNPSSVVNKMKIFQVTLEYFAILGITSQSRPINVRNLMTIIAFAIMVHLLGAYLLCVAANFKEYTESIYITSAVIALFIIFLSVIWNKENIFQFIDF